MPNGLTLGYNQWHGTYGQGSNSPNSGSVSSNSIFSNIRTSIENNGKTDFLSKPLLRTNPQISSNIKLIVSDNEMYLESIDADSLLSNISYKKYLVKEKGSYSYDISSFWKKSNTPLDLVYKVKRDYSDFSILDSYDKQFEESYSYGTVSNYSKLYDYDFKMLAPIWLDKNVPSKFIIYRANNPINSKKYTDSDNLDRINDMLSKSTLIKTIDLSENSKIGKYLRNHVNDEKFISSPLTVSFNKNEQTFFNGIDLEKGGFSRKGEFHGKDTVSTDRPIIEYNKFITEGFYRNSLVCSNLINLEFLFNDTEADDFSVNRYFGIYVDDIKQGEGEVKSINNDLITFSNISHSLNFDNINFNAIEDYWSIPNSVFYKNKPMLGWVKSFSGYHNVKNGYSWDESKLELKIDSNNQDYSNFLGIKKTKRNIDVEKNEIPESDFLEIKIVGNPNENDNFTLVNLQKRRFIIKVIENNVGELINIKDDNGFSINAVSGISIESTLNNIKTAWLSFAMGTFQKYDVEIENIKGNPQIQLIEKVVNLEENHNFIQDNINTCILDLRQSFKSVEFSKYTFYASSSIDRGKISGNSFSNLGTLGNVANAISSIINSNTRFTTELKDDLIIVKSPVKGYNRFKDVLLFKDSNSSFLQIEDREDTDNFLQLGPTPLRTAYYFAGGNDSNNSIYIKTEDLSKIEKGEYLIDSLNSYNKVINIFKDSRTIGSDFSKIILEKNNNNVSGVSNVYKSFSLEWGMFSAYDIYDLNFDFYDTSNSDLKELYLEDQNINYPNVENILNPAYSNIADLIKEPEEYFASLIPILEDEEVKEKDLEKIFSEYERLQENNTTKFATESRVVPYINKWVLNNSLNCRENPYYLNLNEAFGETNFSPNMDTEERDPNNFTHEWFYIDKNPTYLSGDNSNLFFSYVNPSNEINVSEKDLKSINFDYFKTYFLSEGSWVDGDGKLIFGKTEKRKKYTHIQNGDAESFSSTIFKGLRFIPKVRKKIEDSITKEYIKNSEFNGYRFSVVLKTEYDTTSNNLKLKAIQNKKFKFLVLILDLKISEQDTFFFNRKMLYELDHKINPSGVYSDSVITGALKLDEVSLTPNKFTVVYGKESNDGLLPQFTTQILSDPVTGNYGKLNVLVNEIQYEIQIANVINDNAILVYGQMLKNVNGVFIPESTAFYTENQYTEATYSYQNGGIFAHKELLKQLTANNVSRVLNNKNAAEYITIENDGSEVNNKFSIELQDGVEVIKKSNLFPEVDTEKPKAFSLVENVIGYNIKERNEYYSFLTRQNGNYTIDMNPVITFTEPFSMHKLEYDPADMTSNLANIKRYGFNISDETQHVLTSSLYEKFNNCGVLFNLGEIQNSGDNHDERWGTIKNHFFHKVNEIDTQGVIKLSESDDLLPKYALINEIAIDKKNVNIFKSKWEDSYYTRSSFGGKNQNIPGTKNIVEEKAYTASSVMKVGNSYDIYNFNINDKIEDIQELNEIKELNNLDYEIVFLENDKEIIVDFYLNKSISRLLENLGIRKTIEKYVDPLNSFGRIDTLDDDVSAYISNNILPLYSIKKINLYVLEYKGNQSYIESSQNLEEISSNYKLDSNFTYKLDSKNQLNFRLIYNKRIGYSYKIKPVIKIKS